jgi:ribosome biogenesis GTPase
MIIIINSSFLKEQSGRFFITSRTEGCLLKTEMYFLQNGGIVIDNPGMREVGIAAASTGINNVFDEISVLAQKCKFVDCTHTHEPGCKVLSALKSGELNKEKYSNFINLKKETEFYEMSELEKKEKDRQFGKFLKTAKKQLKYRKN